MRSDICTTKIRQLWWQPIFSFCDWTKTMERERRRERIKNTCVYERESCLKSCQKVVVQISFIILDNNFVFYFFHVIFVLLFDYIWIFKNQLKSHMKTSLKNIVLKTRNLYRNETILIWILKNTYANWSKWHEKNDKERNRYLN